MKSCTRCKVGKPFAEYHKDKFSADGYRYYCKTCTRELNNHTTSQLRLKVVNALGAICAGCGIDDVRVLCVDHRNGDGYLRRKEQPSGNKYYQNMLEELDRYQVLCWNCNHLKRVTDRESRRP